MPYVLLRGYEDADESRIYPTVVIDLDHVKDLVGRIDKILEWGKLWEEKSPDGEFNWNPLAAVKFWDRAPRWYDVDLCHYEWCEKQLDMGHPVILEELPEEILKADAEDYPGDKSIRVESAAVVYDGAEPWEITWRAYIKGSNVPIYTQVLNLKELDKVERI
ncbi:MAG TPA: hypothetical protein DCP92_03880 [Nitrospiraceae bacterium]|nr:hypothetical protein [Nitrospiraceae bacterium]